MAQHLPIFPPPTIFSHTVLAPARYYLRWINLWNESCEGGYSVPQGENGYV